MAKLIFIGEKFGGRVYEFVVEKTSVGRGDHNTLTIHDASVSQSHCEILVYGTEVIVRDLGSSNGTFVNGVRLDNQQQRPLHNGQTVKFGFIEARLELMSSSASNTVTDVTAVHAHVRHQREQSEPKPSHPASVTLESSAPSPVADHTMMLPRSAPTAEPPTPPTPPMAAIPGSTAKPPNPAVLVVVVAAILVGLAMLGWFILARSR
jgi:pSer/pThr/pTyr-binding forkhead associated (FHA) protein